jgi:hypothetical protein
MDGVTRAMHRTFGGCLAALLGIAAWPSDVSAATDCAQGRAIYHDVDSGYELTFAGSGTGGTGRFTMTADADAVAFDGFVMWDDVARRTVAVVTHGCPEGDVTGEELAGCTIWQGAVYAVDADGAIGNLGDGEAAAAPRLLLADFARALSLSTYFEDNPATPLPWDAFEHRECAP